MKITIPSYYKHDKCGEEYLQNDEREITFSFDESDSVEIRISSDINHDDVYRISKEELKRLANFIPSTICQDI